MDIKLIEKSGKTIRFEDDGESNYRVTVDSWNNHLVLTIPKDEIKRIVETSENEKTSA